MVRKLRVEYEGAIYHVMNRGDRREPIFTISICALMGGPFTASTDGCWRRSWTVASSRRSDRTKTNAVKAHNTIPCQVLDDETWKRLAVSS